MLGGELMSHKDDKLTASDFTPLLALMAGYAFLMFAGGMNSLVVPIRGSAEGFSTFSLGLLGTSWAIGFITGSIYVPHLVARVGHIRIFAVMAALATMAVILTVLLVHPIAWIPLRAAAGFCFAGAAMIVEAWINERTSRGTRGRVFGIYTMVNLGATTAGQMFLVTGDTGGVVFFLVAAVFYTLAIVPPALSAATKPRPLRKVSFDLPQTWKNSPIAVVAVVLIGVSNGAFGTLAAVFGQKVGLGVAAIATFMSAAILAGALVQIPIGYLSDKFDRRLVLIGIAATAAAVDVFFLITSDFNFYVVVAAGAVFGGAVYSLPPVVMAHANDHSPPDKYVQTSSSLLMMFGAGAIAGPVIAGSIMDFVGERGLFMVTLFAHAVMIFYTIWRTVVHRVKAVAKEDKVAFTRMEPGRVIMAPIELSEMDFGLEEDEESVAPVMPDRIREAFSKKGGDGDKTTNFHKGQSSDDTHGGW